MRRRDIFALIRQEVRTDFVRLLHETIESIRKGVIETCAEIERQISMIKGPESEASRTPADQLRRIKNVVAGAEARMEEAQRLAEKATSEAIKIGWAHK